MSDAGRGVTRRRLLVGGSAATATFLAGGGLARALAPRTVAAAPYLRPQEGIATPPQTRLTLAAFDVTADRPDAVVELLRAWTATIAALTTAAVQEEAGLTVTVGLGPSLFDERFGLAARRPRELAQLPAFRRDMLSAQRSGGDLAVQACADDAAATGHAVAALDAAAAGIARRRWVQTGLRRTSPDGGVTRNLLGFRDGTASIRPGDRRGLRRHVWAPRPAGMAMGTYLVARRIRIHLHAWDGQPHHRQDRAVGRERASGRRITPAPRHAHAHLASPLLNDGVRLLRRSYSYDDGDDEAGVADRGLMFLSFQRDPARFSAIQGTLDRHDDALGPYLVHTSSSVFACPPTPAPDGFLGDALLLG